MEEKHFKDTSIDVVHVSDKVSWKYEMIKLKKRPMVMLALCLLVILFMVIGLEFGLIGTIIGTVFSVLLVIWGPPAVNKTIERNHGS